MYKEYSKEKKIELEKRISDFCQKHDINLGVNSDITEICNNLGFTVLSLELPQNLKDFDGVILVNKDKKTIGINNEVSSKKARFVLAHELSHYITKLEECSNYEESKEVLFATKDRIFHGGEKSELEHDMDYMAAAILVPKDEFKKYLDKFHIKETVIEKAEKIDQQILNFLSYTFNVEEDVIIRRVVEVS